MALTFYLFQTLLGLWFFYGFMPGPDLMGTIGPTWLILCGPVWGDWVLGPSVPCGCLAAPFSIRSGGVAVAVAHILETSIT